LARQADKRLVPAKRVRMDSAARQAQIVRATVRLVGQYGIEGTTVSRIAAEVGLSEMALYRHFDNKVGMLVGALEYLVGRSAEWHSCSSHPWVPTRLCEIGQAHLSMLTADVDMWNSPMMQFAVNRPAQPWVSPVFVDTQPEGDSPTRLGQARQRLYGHIEEGKAQGSIRPDVDPVAFAWLWMSWAQGEDLHYLIAERTGSFNREPHLRLLELIIADIELPERQ
jgi:AcrR family transcriptional regulator